MKTCDEAQLLVVLVLSLLACAEQVHFLSLLALRLRIVDSSSDALLSGEDAPDIDGRSSATLKAMVDSD